MKPPKDRVIIASDVNERDGIGVEIYREDELIIEIFRDDTKRKRTVTLFQKRYFTRLPRRKHSDF